MFYFTLLYLLCLAALARSKKCEIATVWYLSTSRTCIEIQGVVVGKRSTFLSSVKDLCETCTASCLVGRKPIDAWVHFHIVDMVIRTRVSSLTKADG